MIKPQGGFEWGWDTLIWWAKIAAGGTAAIWGGLSPVVQILLWLMLADIATGLLAGFVARTLSSDISFQGLAKKTLVVILVAVAAVLEPVTGAPLAQAVAGFYSAHELLSILENVALAGLPVPPLLRDALSKLSSSTGKRP